jgi:hypothetical protein
MLRLIPILFLTLALAACGATTPQQTSTPATPTVLNLPLEEAPAGDSSAPTEVAPIGDGSEGDATAVAVPVPVSISIEPAIARAGDTVIITASGFTPGEEVVYLSTTAERGFSADTIRLNVDAAGSVRIEVPVTDTTSATFHYVLLSGQVSDLQLKGGYDVTKLTPSELDELRATAVAPASGLLPLRVRPPAMGRTGRVSFEASGFSPGERIAFYLVAPSGLFGIGPVVESNADQQGRVVGRYDFQSDLRQLEAGTWIVRVVGSQSGQVAEGNFIVMEEALTPVPQNAPTVTPLPAATLKCEDITILDPSSSVARQFTFSVGIGRSLPPGSQITEVIYARQLAGLTIIAVRLSEGEVPPFILKGSGNLADVVAILAPDATIDEVIAEGTQNGATIPRILIDFEQCPLIDLPASAPATALEPTTSVVEATTCADLVNLDPAAPETLVIADAYLQSVVGLNDRSGTSVIWARQFGEFVVINVLLTAESLPPAIFQRRGENWVYVAGFDIAPDVEATLAEGRENGVEIPRILVECALQ